MSKYSDFHKKKSNLKSEKINRCGSATDTDINNLLLVVVMLMLVKFLSCFVWRDDVQIPMLTHRLCFTFKAICNSAKW